MNKLTNWNYEESVKRVSAKVTEWKSVTLKKSTLTDEIARELYEAREQLSDRGSRPIWDDSQNWRTFLEEVGLAKSTVHRWLEHFDTEEQRLLTDDEYENKKRIEARKKQDEQTAIKNRVLQAKQIGRKPTDWDEATEIEYQRQLKEDAERDERIRKAKQEMDERKKRREELEKEKYGEKVDISELLEKASKEQSKRYELRERIGLTGDNAFHDFNELLMNYLDTLPSNGQKIEACHNIIKICKGVVSGLQMESMKEADYQLV